MFEYAKYIFLMNDLSMWFLLPDFPAATQMVPPHREQGLDEQLTAMSRKWVAENREKSHTCLSTQALDVREFHKTQIFENGSSQNWKILGGVVTQYVVCA